MPVISKRQRRIAGAAEKGVFETVFPVLSKIFLYSMFSIGEVPTSGYGKRRDALQYDHRQYDSRRRFSSEDFFIAGDAMADFNCG